MCGQCCWLRRRTLCSGVAGRPRWPPRRWRSWAQRRLLSGAGPAMQTSTRSWCLRSRPSSALRPATGRPGTRAPSALRRGRLRRRLRATPSLPRARRMQLPERPSGTPPRLACRGPPPRPAPPPQATVPPRPCVRSLHIRPPWRTAGRASCWRSQWRLHWPSSWSRATSPRRRCCRRAAAGRTWPSGRSWASCRRRSSPRWRVTCWSGSWRGRPPCCWWRSSSCRWASCR
mmetsp:Transcript_45645/g.132203  ORF Transcript_45645/g.132203 Transcript_45645/m.132203 type:complete len:230 (-) Transcript_45645:97-786(-)